MKTKITGIFKPRQVIFALLIGIIIAWLIKDIATPLLLDGKTFEGRSLLVQIAIVISYIFFISVFFLLVFYIFEMLLVKHLIDRERMVVVVIFMAISLPLMFVKSSQWVEGYMDTALLSQMTENIASGKGPYAQLEAGWSGFVNRSIASLSAQELCQVDALSVSDQVPSNIFLRWHAYLITYLLAPLIWIVPVNLLLPSLTVLSYLALIILVYFFLRDKGVSILGSIFFCFLVTLHPSWSEGLWIGQIYFDRFFLLFGSLFIFTFVSKKPNPWLLLLFGFLSAIIVERVGLVLGTFVAVYMVLFWKDRTSTWQVAFVLSVLLFLYSFIMIIFFIQNRDYGSFVPLSINDLVNNFNYPGFTEKLGIFLIMNLSLLVFALFKPRGLIIALGVMIPNMIGNIGGAEKTGWSIHYHVLYLPFLVWAAAEGYAWLYSKLQATDLFSKLSPVYARYKLKSTSVLYGMVFGVILLFGGLNPYAPTIETYNLDRFKELAIIKMIRRVPDYLPGTRLQTTHAIYYQLQEIIPYGSVVSTPEFAMPALYHQRDIWLFPLGIPEADFVINPGGEFSYLGEPDKTLIGECLHSLMIAEGFDMENPIMVGSNISVYQRETSGPNLLP
jgi:hypothetical protein